MSDGGLGPAPPQGGPDPPVGPGGGQLAAHGRPLGPGGGQLAAHGRPLGPGGGPLDASAQQGASQEDLLALAADAARAAGALLFERFAGGAERALASKTTPTDLVSEADLASERLIRERLSAIRPDDALLGEEEGRVEGSSGLTWVVDPLDGTVNFLFGIPQWCVSVSVRDEHGDLAGAVFDPCRDELFCATRDGAALLNGGPLPAPARECAQLSQAMVATGFAYDAGVRAAQAEVLARLLPRVRDIRRFGSAALDLAWTAAGRYDAYFERTVKPWDIAAGALVCERTGLTLRELPAQAGLPWGIVVATPSILEELFELVR